MPHEDTGCTMLFLITITIIIFIFISRTSFFTTELLILLQRVYGSPKVILHHEGPVGSSNNSVFLHLGNPKPYLNPKSKPHTSLHYIYNVPLISRYSRYLDSGCGFFGEDVQWQLVRLRVLGLFNIRGWGAFILNRGRLLSALHPRILQNLLYTPYYMCPCGSLEPF